MLQTFRRDDTSALIVSFKANIDAGMVDDEDAPIRHTVHRTLDGVQVELRQNPPVAVRGDRPIELDCPKLTATELAAIRAMRLGTHGLPVKWENNQIATPVRVLVVAVDSRPHQAHADGTGDDLYTAKVTLQPIA